MREIKFRAWIEDDGLMVYQSNGVEFAFKELKRTIKNLPKKCEKYSAFFVMQCTGLKDKNGKEIYEGDIVNATDTNTIFDIKWRTYGWNLPYKYIPSPIPDDRFGVIATGVCETMNVEIIGNIYENPELLKGENKI